MLWAVRAVGLLSFVIGIKVSDYYAYNIIYVFDILVGVFKF